MNVLAFPILCVLSLFLGLPPQKQYLCVYKTLAILDHAPWSNAHSHNMGAGSSTGCGVVSHGFPNIFAHPSLKAARHNPGPCGENGRDCGMVVSVIQF